MIYDHISNRASYRSDPNLARVLDYLAECGMDNRPDTRVVLDGEKLFVNPVELVTRPEAECFFEAHRRYADVHYILSGCEVIGIAQTSSLRPAEEFDPETDFGKYLGEAMAQVTLRPGDFLVCYPQDAHKVAMMETQPQPVVKLVGKIEGNGQ